MQLLVESLRAGCHEARAARGAGSEAGMEDGRVQAAQLRHPALRARRQLPRQVCGRPERDLADRAARAVELRVADGEREDADDVRGKGPWRLVVPARPPRAVRAQREALSRVLQRSLLEASLRQLCRELLVARLERCAAAAAEVRGGAQRAGGRRWNEPGGERTAHCARRGGALCWRRSCIEESYCIVLTRRPVACMPKVVDSRL